jgi:GTP-binding protein HflX
VLHVIDASHPQFSEQREIGDAVLEDLGVDSANVIEVYNKSDRMDEHFDVSRRNTAVVSALTGAGIEKLVSMIRDRERERGETLHLSIPHGEAKLIAKLHELGEIHEQRATDDATLLTAWIPRDALHQFAAYVVKPAASEAKRRSA